MPKLNPFSFSGLLLVVGGRHWLLLAEVALIGLVALWFGFRWAIRGTGYWPRGVLGRALFVALLLIVPAAVVLLVRLIGVGIEKQPTWYRPLGAIPESVPTARCVEDSLSRLPPLRSVG